MHDRGISSGKRVSVWAADWRSSGQRSRRRCVLLPRATTARATPLLLPAMGRGRKAAKTRAIAFGFQVVLGTLVNAILNDPGPLSIHDKEMEKRLADCLLLLLKAEMN